MGEAGGTEKYRLGERIGGGGMAEVFEAVLVGAEGFARPVAVKRMIPTLSVDPAFGQMFVNEARIASLLHHANIGAVLDFDRDAEGRYFIVMELIRGLDLRRLMDSGRLPIGSSVQVVTEMLRGLDYAHELEHEGRRLGIVHRDISPHNVMLSWDGAVKVVDFGIAKILAATGVSRSGTIKGKLAYMSPEQAGAADLDGRSDLFAVGVILHELLTGQRLFRGQTEPEVLARLLTQPIPRPSEVAPDVPAELDAVVMSLLERDREARTPSAGDALEVLLGTAAASTRGAIELQRLLGERFPDKARKRRAPSAAASTPSPATPVTPSLPSPVTPSPVTPVTATPTAVTQVSPTEATAPQTPAAMAAAPPAATLTARPSVATAIDPAPEVAPARAGPARRRRGRPWLAGGVVVLVVAAVTAGALVARNASSQGTEKAAAPAAIDAGAGPVAREEPSPPAPAATSADAAPVASAPVASAPAASAPAGSTHRTGHGKPEDRTRRDGPPGKVHVTVMPWAEVTVDGARRGQTPITVDLTPGAHKVLLRNREVGKSETVPVDIESGKTTSIDRDWN